MFLGLTAIGCGLFYLSQRRSDMKQAELVARLTAVGAAVTKIGTETSTLLSNVADLRQQLTDEADGDLSPETEAALAAVEASVNTVDNLVPDATPPVVAPADPATPDAPSGVVETPVADDGGTPADTSLS